MSNGDDPDAFWRRPPERPGDEYRSGGPPPAGSSPAGPPGGSGYPGPPPTTPPPPGWRPPVHVQPAPPRQLPAQDPVVLDAEERGARSLTTGVALVAGAILVVVVCLLCSRLLS